MRKSIFQKSLLVLGVVTSLVFVSSCGDDKPVNEDGIVVDDDYYEFQTFNLQQDEIPAMISLPDETANIGASTKPEVKHIQSDILWEINVGPNFQLMIEDYADFTDLIEVKKKELAEQSFFKIKYLIDEDDMIVYERTLLVKGTDKASPTVGIEHRSYHVYAQKIIGDITYELQSRPDGYEQMIIELMAKSIKSFKPIKAD